MELKDISIEIILKSGVFFSMMHIFYALFDDTSVSMVFKIILHQNRLT